MLLAQFALTAAVALAPQDSQPTKGDLLAPPDGKLSVLYLANEGVLIRSGDVTILIDAFVGKTENGFEELPRNVSRMIATASAPFDGRILALVSHPHTDHLQVRLAERFLNANRKAGMVTSPEVLQRIANRAENFNTIKRQIRTVSPTLDKPQRFDVGDSGATVKAILLPHASEGDTTSVNFAHLITMGPHRLLHLGDAAVDPKLFASLDFASKKIDVAIVPYWFFLSPEGVDIIDNSIAAMYVIVTHIPVAEKETFLKQLAEKNPHILHFNESMESKIFDKQPRSK